MREPYFWSAGLDPRSRAAAPLTRFLLTPLAWLYALATARRIARTSPTKVAAKVICVGNITAGGVGKSPIVHSLRTTLSNRGSRAASLSRGYKGKLKGPLRVDPTIHTAQDVGDEPLMLAMDGESWISADRGAAGLAMSEAGVEVIIMDDGHQNPGLAKDLSIVVVDSKRAFGNGYIIPKGPLREPVSVGLERADLVIVVGSGPIPDAVIASARPVLRASLQVTEPPAAGHYVAFAGIGHPERFFDTLAAQPDIVMVDAIPFGDHHSFSDADMTYLHKLAKDRHAQLITTQKDFIRLSQSLRENVAVLAVDMVFDEKARLEQILTGIVGDIEI